MRRLLGGLYSPELLEARIAPATFIVTSLADPPIDTAGTLRHAIGLANDAAHVGPDTITFDPALFPGGAPGTISLIGGAQIVISDTLTIKGPGPDKLTISANASRIFNIADGNGAVLHPTTISGITFRDGNAGAGNYGGAINSTESLSLSNVVLHSNVADSGGGVNVRTEGKVVITNVKFTDNAATVNSGGGLYAVATGGILVTKSLVSGNSAATGGGGLYLKTLNAKATIVVDTTSFIDNSAPGRSGGGLHLRGADLGKLALKNSTFTGNTSKTGGALYLNNGVITVDRTVFAHNAATEDGGAIADNRGTSLKITNSRFEHNTAAGEGGALYLASAGPVSITGSVFTGNQSTTSGGAIHVQNAIALTVKASSFTGNEATTNGGAMSLADAGTSLVLTASTVSGNAAVNGGGIFADEGGKLTVTGGSFIGNLASNAAGTVGNGGAIETAGSGVNAVNLSVTGTLFQANRAIVDGGAIFATGDGKLFLKNARVLGNFAGGNGGGTYLLTTTTATVVGSLFQHNVSGDHGGGTAIALAATAVGTVTSSKFLDNFAVTGGGLDIFGLAGATLTIKNSVITGNVASIEGGGLRKSQAGAPALTLIANVISGNWAPTGPNTVIVP